MSGAGGRLTDEQKRKIEENKRKALAKLAEKQSKTVPHVLQTSDDLQKRKIEENRQRALAKLAEKQSKSGATTKISQPFVHPATPQLQHGRQLSSSHSTPLSTVPHTNHPVIKSPPSFTHGQGQSSLSMDNRCATTTSSAKNFYGNSSNVRSIHTKVDHNSAVKMPGNFGSTSSSGFYSGQRNQNFSQTKPNRSALISSINQKANNAVALLTSTGSTAAATSQLMSPASPTKTTFLGGGVRGHCVLVSRERFEVQAGYHIIMIEMFKSMNTKSYDAASKKWSFRLEEHDKLLQALQDLKPDVHIEPLPASIRTTFNCQMKGVYPCLDIPDADLSRIDPMLENALMPFQRTGVSFGVWKKGRVLIADDMGLGKTIQAICLACYYRDEWPLLIVVPSSVRFDWSQQLRRWVPSLDPQSINVITSGKEFNTSGKVTIVSYDLMARNIEHLQQCRFQVIIMDESHLLKSVKAARTRAAKPLLQSARRVILLTGTPALSRPSELFTQIVVVAPRLFQYHEYGLRYCAAKQLPWGWDYSGSSNMGELQLLLEEKVMIRRLKKDVLSQLPAKRRQMVLLDPSLIKNSQNLQRASKAMNYKNLKGMERRGALLDYFHETARAKVSAVRDYVTDLLETDKKFLLFAHHQELLNAVESTLETKYGRCFIRIDGKTSSEQRKYFCDQFQNKDDIKVALLSITAANAGLNLCAASLVVFAELFWNPGILVQAEDRVHRIGQQDSVNIHYLVAKGTADDHIWPLVQNKLGVLGKAGLAKEDFSEADTTRMQDSRQTDLRHYFEESFFEEDDSLPVEDDSLPVEDDTNKLDASASYSNANTNPSHTSPVRQLGITKFLKPVDKNSVTKMAADLTCLPGPCHGMEVAHEETHTAGDLDALDDGCDWLDDVDDWGEAVDEPATKKLRT